MTSFINALEFLTILHVPRKRVLELADIGQSSTFFPLVGLVLGLILVGANLLLLELFSKQIVSAFLVFLLVVLTRGIHLDGLADSIDGIWGGNSREQRLEIMKDSSIGVFGASAIFFALLFKFLFLTALPSLVENSALLAMLVLSRWSLVFAIFLGQPARTEGLGQIFVKHSSVKQFILATLATLVIAVVLFKLTAIPLVIGLALFTCLLVKLASTQFGGLTGDTFGAFAELSELFCLAFIYTLAQLHFLK